MKLNYRKEKYIFIPLIIKDFIETILFKLNLFIEKKNYFYI